MTTDHSRPHHGGLRLGRRVLHQLRSALERDTGLQASTYLQEAGFAGGEELYAEFREWLLANRGVEDPPQLDAEFLSETLSAFFADQGWGRLQATRLGDAVLALDSAEWAESVETGGTEFPSCHLTCGGLAGDPGHPLRPDGPGHRLRGGAGPQFVDLSRRTFPDPVSIATRPGPLPRRP